MGEITDEPTPRIAPLPGEAPRYGERWTSSEDMQLVRYLKEKMDVGDVAIHMKRTRGAVVARVMLLADEKLRLSEAIKTLVED